MQNSFVIALFLGAASSMRLNTVQRVSTEFVELPMCASLGDASGNFTNPKEVPLKDDLSNAIIATCKGPLPVATPNATDTGDGAASAGQTDNSTGWTAKPASTIYDPVHKTSTSIPDTEHQVDLRAHGNVGQNRSGDP